MTDPPPNTARMDDDLRRIFDLALDLNYYRSVEDDGGRGRASYVELYHAVQNLPEAKS